MTDLDTEATVSEPMPRHPELLFDPSLRTAAGTRDGARFPFPLPNGWFIVAPSTDVAAGAITPLHYFDRDLVLFRTATGHARVTSAYCAHLGSHLGVGGRVAGETIVCPFHGWCYDGASGQCARIPYGAGRIPSQAKVRAYPTLERNGMIWVWFHLEGLEPFYDVPEVAEFDDPEWSDPVTFEFTIRTCAQEMAENNHDPVHFKFVHGTDAIPEEEILIDGTYKRTAGWGGSFVRETFGLGLGVLRVAGVVTFFSSVTPIDGDNVHVRWTFLSPREHGPEAAEKAAREFLAGVSQDVPIWENKRYVERPVLVKEERTILDHREWCQQFYSDPRRAID